MIAKMGIWWWKPWFWEWWWWKRMMVRRRMVMEGKEVISSALLAKNIYNSFHLYCTIGKPNKREKWSTLRNGTPPIDILSGLSSDFFQQYTQGFMNPTHPTPKSRKVKQMLNISTNIANSSTVPRIESLNSTVLEMTDWLERQVEDAIGGKQEHLGYALCFMCNFNSVSAVVGSFWESPYSCHNAMLLIFFSPLQCLLACQALCISSIMETK